MAVPAPGTPAPPRHEADGKATPPRPDAPPTPTPTERARTGERQPHDEPLACTLTADRGTRGLLIVLVVTCVFFVLYIANQVFVPLVAGFLLAMLFKPLVRRLEAFRLKPGLAAVLIILTLGGTVVGAGALATPAVQQVAQDLPQTSQAFQRKARVLGREWGITRLVEAVRGIGSTTTGGGPTDDAEIEIFRDDDGSTPPINLPLIRLGGGDIADDEEAPQVDVVVAAPAASEPQTAVPGGVLNTLLNQTQSFLVGLMMTLVLMFFFLASGDMFLRKIVRMLPRLDEKREAVEAAREIERDVSHYLVTITLINIGVGVVQAAGFWAVGLNNPIFWGAVGAALNYIPYVGPIVLAGMVGAAGVLQFDDLPSALLPVAVVFVVNMIEGYGITPVIMGRRLKLNPVMVLVALLLWGWLWGIPGALMAVPMLVCFRIVCDHVEALAGVGELLADEEG